METRASLAAEAFAATARYDTAIARWFAEREADEFPPLHVRAYEKIVASLIRRESAPARRLLLAGRRAHAPAVDGAPALGQAALLQQPARPRLGAPPRGGPGNGNHAGRPTCVIVKHNTPCGAAVGETALAAYQKAFACDPLSAYGVP